VQAATDAVREAAVAALDVAVKALEEARGSVRCSCTLDGSGAGGGLFCDSGESDSESVDVEAVSKRVQAKVDEFAKKYNLGEEIRSRLAASDDEAVTRVVVKELCQRVRNPNTYVTRMLRTSERGVDNEREEEGNYEDVDFEGGRADVSYEY
jgi:hypothetical protein